MSMKNNVQNLSLRINEIFKSIQGESTSTGLPFVFIRLTGCNLRCTYCDTVYAYDEGTDMTLNEIIDVVKRFNCKKVCITGGEPLLQENVCILITLLLKMGYKISVETNGSIDISMLPGKATRIMDIKCPDSKMNNEMDWNNIMRLRPNDEIKFIISSKKDYEWAKKLAIKYNLIDKTKVLFGLAHGRIKPKTLAGWILKDNLDVRFQMQLHKYIWPDKNRGV